MQTVEQQELLRLEDIPVLLCSILQELRVMNGKAPMPAQQDVIIEPKHVEIEAQKAEEAAEEENEEDVLTHEKLTDHLTRLIFKKRENSVLIKSIIARYSEGKLNDVPLEKLPALKADIDAEVPSE